MSDRQFGKPENIGKRLAYWANQLSRDKSYPWVGTGLIDDLKCAAGLHGADFDKLYPLEFDKPKPEPERIPDPVEEEDEFAHFQPSAPPEDWELVTVQVREYDL